ncbi:hypothetical protein Tco_0183584 [Tanacetum coccineum]
MHNNIMAAGSKDRPPMLATGIYAQWQSHFMRYVGTKSNKKELKKCIFDGPYVMTRVLILEKPATETDPPVPECIIPKTYENTLPKNHAYINAEAKAIHLILTRIRDDIDSTIDACTTAKEMWIAIERLLFDILIQYHNEIRAKKLARNANPLALVADAQHYPNEYNQTPKSHQTHAPSSRQTSSSRSHAPTRTKGKEIAKPVTPPSESALDEDSDPKQA